MRSNFLNLKRRFRSPLPLKIKPGYVVLRIKGHGMTAEQIEQIGAYIQFERTYYAQRGSGLGLAIVQLLVQLHRGTLTVESTPQQGTTVTITFPYQAA